MPGSAPGAPPSTLMPVLSPRSNETMVAIRVRSGTSTNETSSASSVPARSSAASTPSGAAARTRSIRPDPYSTGMAPSWRRKSCRAGRAVATTVAPRSTASCTAMTPTPPAAPWISTVSPTLTPVTASRCQAVTPATISPEAWAQSSVSGFGTNAEAGTTSSAA